MSSSSGSGDDGVFPDSSFMKFFYEVSSDLRIVSVEQELVLTVQVKFLFLDNFQSSALSFVNREGCRFMFITCLPPSPFKSTAFFLHLIEGAGIARVVIVFFDGMSFNGSTHI